MKISKIRGAGYYIESSNKIVHARGRGLKFSGLHPVSP